MLEKIGKESYCCLRRTKNKSKGTGTEIEEAGTRGGEDGEEEQDEGRTKRRRQEETDHATASSSDHRGADKDAQVDGAGGDIDQGVGKRGEK